MCGFFFQAEDGIRDTSVTGVQTCALPISNGQAGRESLKAYSKVSNLSIPITTMQHWLRSEERRVGKECRARWSAYNSKKKDNREVIVTRHGVQTEHFPAA